MKKINLLDCTLRDGGYINNWNFGHEQICAILEHLCASNVEYVECGYLSEKKGKDENYTQYRNLDALFKVLPQNAFGTQFAVMIDYGQYEIGNIPYARTGDPIIRVCFHKKDAEEALLFCKGLMEKGYTVFVQPMASLNYTDLEFVEIIKKVNDMRPACFYIVDSFGVIEIEDFQRLLFIADHNLGEGIILGYHAHNNLQQAYGNAKYMVEQNLTHDIMLDASVYGMGRGAGNLNMELFASYLNKNYNKTYSIDPFLDIMDQYLKPIFVEHFWGYSLPFYLSAQYNCHPNYAGYFSDKNTLSNRSMRQLLFSLPEDVKIRYSAEEAEKYYQAFQEKYVDDTESCNTIKRSIGERDVLILAPGKTLVDEKDKIERYISQHKPVIFGVNVSPCDYKCDYIICTNEKRERELKVPSDCGIILSSNLKDSEYAVRALLINYSTYLGNQSMIADNPTLMLLRLLSSIGIKKVVLAGFDGYSSNPRENYFNEKLSLGTSTQLKLQKNNLIREALCEIRPRITPIFLTKSLYSEAL